MQFTKTGAKTFGLGVLQSVVGALVLTILCAVWQAIRHTPIDWLAISALFLLTSAIFTLLLWFTHAHFSSASIEQAVEQYLTSKGVVPNEPASVEVEHASVESNPNPTLPQIFDAEVYRLVCAPKNPFARQTRDFMRSLGRGDEFKIGVDILLELYVVNLSPDTQYIRDIYGFVEIEGTKIPLVMQQGFHAYELNDKPCEWCLDPTPKDASGLSFYDRQQKLESLLPLAHTFPVALESRKPLEGWIRLLISEIDPDKLDKVDDYHLTIKSSTGVEYAITKATKRHDKGEISSRVIGVD